MTRLWVGKGLMRIAAALVFSQTLGLCGCGGIKDLDPLGVALGGATDTARYNFESGVQGWGCSSTQGSQTYGGSCVEVAQDQGQSFAGKSSLLVDMNLAIIGALATGITSTSAAVSVVFSAPTTQDLAGKTVSAWIYAPTSIAPGTSDPSYAQIYMVDGSSDYANGSGVNLVGGTWSHLTFAPVTNNTGQVVSGTAQPYYAAGFNVQQIHELGIKVALSGQAPPGFSYSGPVLVDSVHW